MIIFTYVIDLIFASLFLISALMKVQSREDFFLEIKSYKVIPNRIVKSMGISVLILELLVSIMFLAGYPNVRWLLATTILVFFSGLLLVRGRRLKKNNCSCFGRAKLLNKYPTARNAMLITIALAGFCFFPARHIGWQDFFILSSCTIIIVLTTLIITTRKDKLEELRYFNMADMTIGKSKFDLTLIVFNYKTPYLSVIDDYLVQLKGFTILFKAPEHVQRMKSALWLNHNIITIKADKVESEMLEVADPIIFVKKNERVVRYDQVIPFLDDLATKRRVTVPR
ncbi:hypothetical protein A7K91_20755 [Paenibacillus oryzae]|uniref:Methylamine utilisation protein MauE domain-containing protein n=1 Tax=Paenibacillus oryzae TaxID=1844972 RepID=A0A1A5YKT5_9BACL|nr:MauE/DoxX family redox-associated membrane protein [Paenibacillus oryzae]OBR66168.1 hypothetical protein A7K91_20755 [Paenibacillus oryzae]